MVYFRYFPLTLSSLSISLRDKSAGSRFGRTKFARRGTDMEVCQQRVRGEGNSITHFYSFLKWVFILLMFVSFIGCATSTFSSRTPAKVEDRSSPETAAPAKAPEQSTARVYKLEDPEYVVPQPLPEATIEERSEELPPAELSVQQSREQTSSPAVVALLDDADKYATTGKKQEAVASIERALRIDPKNPLLWHKLGQVRLQEGNWDQAIAMAKKSSVLAPGNRLLQSENWMIIARASEGKGDTAGAMHARDMAKQLRTY